MAKAVWFGSLDLQMLGAPFLKDNAKHPNSYKRPSFVLVGASMGEGFFFARPKISQ